MSRNRKIFFIMAALTFATVVSIGLVYPTPVPSPTLGVDWQCHRSAIVTTCKWIGRAEPTVHRARAMVTGLRPV